MRERREALPEMDDPMILHVFYSLDTKILILSDLSQSLILEGKEVGVFGLASLVPKRL